MKSIHILSILTISLIGLSSCEKHHGDYEAPAPASSISFSSPVPGQVKLQGDSVWVHAIAIAQETLHGCDVSIKNANDTTVYFTKHVHTHNDTLNISEVWVNNLRGPLELEATIRIILDHDGNTNSKTIRFAVQ